MLSPKINSKIYFQRENWKFSVVMLLSALHIDYPRQVVTLSTTIMEGHRAAEPIMDLVTTFALLVSSKH